MEPIEIDLNAAKSGKLNEALNIYGLGDSIMLSLQKMFGFQAVPPINVRGTSQQISAFGNALIGEKKYIDAYLKHGLDDPRTLRDKEMLDVAVRDFEFETGLSWPFK